MFPTHGENFKTISTFDIEEGQRLHFVFGWHPSHEPTPPRIDPDVALTSTEEWWTDWTTRCTYDGRWKDAVVRSLITLKALPTSRLMVAAFKQVPSYPGAHRRSSR
jgi:GH15 family glucan-1,4-alpha-glucosidase